MAGSADPIVTSASGAKSTLKPIPASSAPLAAYTLRVSASSSAAPLVMNVGNPVAPAVTRCTRPPSWSTPTSSGQPRPSCRTDASRARLDRRIWLALATFSLNTMTPPRCSLRTNETGGPVPE
jgi:hypothetical protein